jgi:hypothetical protein
MEITSEILSLVIFGCMCRLDPIHQCPVRYHQYVDGVLTYKEQILLKINPTQHAVLIQSRHHNLFSQ